MADILVVEGEERRLLGRDRPRRAVKQALTRGFLNEVTQLVETSVTLGQVK
jgi:hypothetical protein